MSYCLNVLPSFVSFSPETPRAGNCVKKSRWIRAPDLGEPSCCTTSQWPRTLFFFILFLPPLSDTRPPLDSRLRQPALRWFSESLLSAVSHVFFRDGTFHTEYNRPATFKVFTVFLLDRGWVGRACITSISSNCLASAVLLDV